MGILFSFSISVSLFAKIKIENFVAKINLGWVCWVRIKGRMGLNELADPEKIFFFPI